MPHYVTQLTGRYELFHGFRKIRVRPGITRNSSAESRHDFVEPQPVKGSRKSSSGARYLQAYYPPAGLDRPRHLREERVEVRYVPRPVRYRRRVEGVVLYLGQVRRVPEPVLDVRRWS